MGAVDQESRELGDPRGEALDAVRAEQPQDDQDAATAALVNAALRDGARS